MGFFEKIKKGLTKTKKSIGSIFPAFRAVDEEFYDELEERMILADIGVETSVKAVEALRERVKAQKLRDEDSVHEALRDILTEMLEVGSPSLNIGTKPSVILPPATVRSRLSRGREILRKKLEKEIRT